MKLENLWALHVATMKTETDSYWWCAESLQAEDPAGAKLNPDPFWMSTRIWAHPDLLAQEKREREIEDELD